MHRHIRTNLARGADALVSARMKITLKALHLQDHRRVLCRPGGDLSLLWRAISKVPYGWQRRAQKERPMSWVWIARKTSAAVALSHQSNHGAVTENHTPSCGPGTSAPAIASRRTNDQVRQRRSGLTPGDAQDGSDLDSFQGRCFRRRLVQPRARARVGRSQGDARAVEGAEARRVGDSSGPYQTRANLSRTRPYRPLKKGSRCLASATMCGSTAATSKNGWPRPDSRLRWSGTLGSSTRLL